MTSRSFAKPVFRVLDFMRCLKTGQTWLLAQSPLLQATLIVLAILLIYWNSLEVPFIFDGIVYVQNNPVVQENISKLLDRRYLNSLVGAMHFDHVLNMMLRPIAYLTFMLNHRIHGFEVFGYHVLNIFIHAVTSLLVFSLVRLLLVTPWASGNGFASKYRHFLPFWVALIYACHPIQTQAVTYIVQRFTSLVSLFYVATLVLYLMSRMSSSKRRSILLLASSIITAFLAMGTKETAFTLPIMVVVLEFSFFYGALRSRIGTLLPYLSLLPLIPLNLAATMRIHGMGEDFLDDTMHIASSHRNMQISYLFTQFRVIVTYLRLLVLPVNQNFDYDYPWYNSLLQAPVMLSCLMLSAIIVTSVIAFRFSRRSGQWMVPARFFAVGIVWFFVTISVSSSVFVLDDVISEHRLYLPSFGLIFAAASLTAGVWLALKERHLLFSRLIPLSAAIVVLSLAIATVNRNRVWGDKVTFWSDVISKSPNKSRPYQYLGLSYVNLGRDDQAVYFFKKAIDLNPDEIAHHLNYGIAQVRLRNRDEAHSAFQKVLSLKANSPDAAKHLGMIYLVEDQYEKAAQLFNIWAIYSQPPSSEAYWYLSFVLKQAGQIEEAKAADRMAEKLQGVVGD